MRLVLTTGIYATPDNGTDPNKAVLILLQLAFADSIKEALTVS